MLNFQSRNALWPDQPDCSEQVNIPLKKERVT